MEVDKNLKKLAKEFNKLKCQLYIVGGYVRNNLLALPPTDIDLTSSLDLQTVQDICKKLNFKCKVINKNLGTLQISIEDSTYEYTRFRKESYLTGHTPNEVEFVDDIKIDALRRDATINAIYFDILKNTLVDPVGGLKDLENKIIKTPNLPSITLADDGLRILRLIRFACTYGFCLDRKTLKSLINNTANLSKISKERILKELQLILVADLNYDNSQKLCMHLFNKTRIYPYIFNSTISNLKKIKQALIDKFYTLSNLARQIGFYILVLKTHFKGFVKDDHLAFYINSLLGIEGLKESRENINLTQKLYKIYQNLNYGLDSVNATINYLSLSNTEREIVECYLSKQSKEALSVNISYIKSKKLPLGVQDLDVAPEDLINAKIENRYISKILSTLYNLVIECKVKNSKDDLIECAKNIDETFKNNV